MMKMKNNELRYVAIATCTILIYLYSSHLSRMTSLQKLRAEILKHAYDERSIQPTKKNILDNNEIKQLSSKLLNDVIMTLQESFKPEQKGDNNFKNDLKYALRDKIQQVVTKELHHTLKSSLKEIADAVLKEGIKDVPKTQNLCSSSKNLPMGQKVLSYAVFGTRALYYEGIPILLRQAVSSRLYHDFRLRVYHDALITPQIKQKYAEFKNLDFCDTRVLPKYGNLTGILGKFWRNIPMADDTVDLFCSRDLDSGLYTREEDAVSEWIKSGKIMHTMRDYKQHHVGILAGMWCFRPSLNRVLAKGFIDTLLDRAKTYTLRTDQPLLNEVIWDGLPDKSNNVIQHDAFWCHFYNGSIPFPTQRKDNMEFVGCPGHICNWKNMPKCPEACRPKDHKNWEFC